ncbi:MAG TPA: hypothetical protein EYP56_17350 [Planctomycetaceae bacterium]|nr:hypothetical protein [Planctomycetaceae bacterium]HIQ22486.1 hypothetical protein [Planctomycetota bacterium]
MLSVLRILWALPWTVFGLAVGGLGLLAGGRAQRRGRVIEFYGPGAAWFLRIFPLVAGASAVTFGHTVLARDRAALESARSHEFVHVRQYERWGLFFVPAYLICWLVLWIRGKNPYHDNPFEKEAYRREGWDRG